MARVRVPGGLLTAARLRELGAAAASLGSGVIELTSRANVQVRGLDGGGATAFASRMAGAGLLPSASHERVRNILASPMAGLDGHGLIEVASLVHDLDEALCDVPELADLPGRFLFAIDDGRGDMPPYTPDITLLPLPPPPPSTTGRARNAAAPPPSPTTAGCTRDVTPPTPSTTDCARDMTPLHPPTDRATDVTPPGPSIAGGDGEVALLLGGEDVGLRVALSRGVAAMIAAASAFLAERAERNPAAWRLSELDDGPARVAARLITASPSLGAKLTEARPSPAATPPPLSPGLVQHVLVVMAPLGRLTAAQADVLAAAAEAGAGEIRLTPGRGAVVPGLSRADGERWSSELAGAGLVIDPASPWTGVTACAGRPGCAKSLADVQADAARSIALDGAPTGPGALPVHWAGCERKCGRPSGPAVLVVATPGGYRVDATGLSSHHTDIRGTTAAATTARTTTTTRTVPPTRSPDPAKAGVHDGGSVTGAGSATGTGSVTGAGP
ncbi:precorrin-3B synthase [Sphaerisporangium corydalis]|uniref:Precorrin-3B synthase n=1 Tax=Sphaerisporangium corydalis TaxID=1441875 RepID=A0ABV9E949_9ACTN|nr:precorrin-3B synthase [Sphaerisporangium corydalis]